MCSCPLSGVAALLGHSGLGSGQQGHTQPLIEVCPGGRGGPNRPQPCPQGAGAGASSGRVQPSLRHRTPVGREGLSKR